MTQKIKLGGKPDFQKIAQIVATESGKTSGFVVEPLEASTLGQLARLLYDECKKALLKDP
jgi:hypothetical protein